jgi:endonuclease/exonuclease/phosphatase family metal-dependent hydrolase
MTLNVAHGRKNGPFQLFQRKEDIQSNLVDIADVIEREGPDVVALQEIDGPSFWSGGFNHVRYLTLRAGMDHWVRGRHVQGRGLSYGTALLSKRPLRDVISYRFAPSRPTLRKGFVVSSVSWPGYPQIQIDVVSLHLDFFRSSVRHRQVEDLIEQLSERGNPLIVMGDFNTDSFRRGSPLRVLMNKLSLRVYQPSAPDLLTFSKTRKRLDWIFISPEMEFNSYEVLPDVLSDHAVVMAEISLAKPGSAFVPQGVPAHNPLFLQ